MERRHEIEPDVLSPSHFSDVFHSLIEMSLKTMSDKILIIAKKVADRVSVPSH